MRLRRAFGLVELLVSLAVTGIAAVVIIRTLVSQQRFYSSASAVLDVRAQMRDAADVLATDIRNASAHSPSFVLLLDSAIEMYSTIAASIVCTVQSEQTVGLPPVTISSGASLTSMLAQPDTGDLAVVLTYPPGHPDSGQWNSQRVAAFAQRSVATICPAASGFTSSPDIGGATAYEAVLASPPLHPLAVGNPIRFLRRGRYSLYKSSDNRWYLGYRRCNTTGCAGVQPISGPYDPYSASVSGLEFRYFDSGGARLGSASDGTLVSRVDIVIRGKSSRRTTLAGDARATYADSSVISVSPRNRMR
ncbi:MAG TPA: type II secretion system protein [Gemmatimonadaceae bacterium]|nr:type II secretion system protein [Gemmatimonadaceae bacterium]